MSNAFTTIAPFLAAAGNELTNWDENLTGGDDWAGQLLLHVAEAGTAISEGGDLPPLPEIIAKGTSEKITGALKLTLRIASSALTIAQFQVSGKAAAYLKYVNQALRNLLAGVPVPPAPDTLKA